MRGFGRVLGRLLVLLGLIGGAAWAFGPYEDTTLTAGFEPRKFGEGVQVYFESIESQYSDIVPGTEKRVIWAGQQETRTPISILYVHGFAASSEEIRPVPDQLAEALGANLVYTRLQGHGRGGDAMAEATVQGWMMDMAESLAAARAAGDRVVVLSTSTGGTLVVAAMTDPVMRDKVAGLIFVSPNFGINHPLAFVGTFPFARQIIAMIEGERRSYEPSSPEQAKYWTTDYPTSSLAVLSALIKAVNQIDMSTIPVPALFWLSPDDRIVRADLSEAVAARWGGPVTVVRVVMGPGDDPDAHVIAGAIKSPGQTQSAVAGMLDWIGTLEQ